MVLYAETSEKKKNNSGSLEVMLMWKRLRSVQMVVLPFLLLSSPPFIWALANRAGQIHRWATVMVWIGMKTQSAMRQWHTSFNHLKWFLFKVKNTVINPKRKCHLAQNWRTCYHKKEIWSIRIKKWCMWLNDYK